MNLTEKEIEKIIYCICLIIQNFGDDEALEKILSKLIRMKDKKPKYCRDRILND